MLKYTVEGVFGKELVLQVIYPAQTWPVSSCFKKP